MTTEFSRGVAESTTKYETTDHTDDPARPSAGTKDIEQELTEETEKEFP